MGWPVRVVAANADHFAAVCLDGRHVSGSQVSRCERLRQLTAATWLNLLHLVKIAQRGERAGWGLPFDNFSLASFPNAWRRKIQKSVTSHFPLTPSDVVLTSTHPERG
jgi:hypothetical protein